MTETGRIGTGASLDHVQWVGLSTGRGHVLARAQRGTLKLDTLVMQFWLKNSS